MGELVGPIRMLVAMNPVFSIMLRDEITDAEERGDAARLREAERARFTVTKGIRAVLAKIQTARPALARHLTTTVRRGYTASTSRIPATPSHGSGDEGRSIGVESVRR
jgi:hypothetical protein